MLTPKQVQEKTFPKAVFGGYDMASIDEFLEPLTEDYITLYKENEELKNNQKVLIDAVENYRNTEDAMRNVLANAQKTADQLIAKAKAEAEEILKNANKTAAQTHVEIDDEIKAHQMKLDAARQNTADYIGKMRRIYEEQLSFLTRLESLEEHRVQDTKPAEKPAAQTQEQKLEFVDLQFDREYELK